MTVRGHEPVDLSNLKGLWSRGDPTNTPLDHMQDCNNIQFKGNNFHTRHGLGISQTVAAPLENVKRIYNYPTTTANTTLVLTYDGTNGNIYHVVNASTVFLILGPIAGMEDFAFVPYAGRAYISPFKSFDTGDLNIQKGMQSQTLYVYLGNGTTARAAAGSGPTNTPLTIANGAAGNTDAGFHIFATVFEYNTGYLSPPSQFTTFTTSPNNSVSFAGIQTSGSANVTFVHIVVTKVITNYNGNTEGYQFFFIPNAKVANGVTVLNNVSFFDADLLEDASHLIDNYTSIPAGAVLALYHDRLCLATTFDDISIILVSAPGEPEAINQIDGLMVVPPDGNPITNIAELRDIMYVFKRSRTISYNDTGEEPSEWKDSPIDAGLGTCVHGIATVLDSGNANVDFFMVATYAGIILFNGRYILPELTFKIEQLWKDQDRNEYRRIQIANCPTRKEIYVVLPDYRLLIGNYQNGMDPKNIRWAPASWYTIVNAVGIVNIDEIIIGCEHPNDLP